MAHKQQKMEVCPRQKSRRRCHSAEGSTLITKLFTGTRNFASGFFTTILFLLFLLVSGDTFLRRLVEILPSFSNKRQAVDIFQQVESDISAYLVTITLMNAAVGIGTAMVMWLTGTGDPILSFPKIISGRIGGAVQPGSEWRQWRQIVGLLDARVHLSVMPSASVLDCNTPHMRKEFAAGAPRRR
jgi:hypothetical protein